MLSKQSFLNNSFQRNQFQNDSNSAEYNHFINWTIYGFVMFAILTVGFVGNLLTIIVFQQRKHRTKVIAPFIINLAVADLFIIVFGYPVAIASNLSGHKIVAGSKICSWSAFVNGSIGIAAIAMLTEISFIICYSITTIKPPKRKCLSIKFKAFLIIGAWIYGILCMVPPFLGWNRFVPGSAEISCAPEWWSENTLASAYNILLMFAGFFVPVTVIFLCYYRIYRYLAINSLLSKQSSLLVRRRKSQIKCARMMAVSILAFVVSWSPYCVVCIAAMVKHDKLLQSGEAEIPELMAKASVIYNPMVYAAMNRDVRRTLKNIVACRKQRGDRRDSVRNDLTRHSYSAV